MKFSDIPQLTKEGHYCVDIPVRYLQESINGWVLERRSAALNLNPDYQRDHVWTEEQRVRYVEFILKGGTTNKTFYLNCPGWMRNYKGPFELVDGKQRLTSLLMFLNDELRAFGCLYSEFEDKVSHTVTIKVHINDLPNRKAVLQWYVDMNTGGTVHTSEEIEKVKQLIELEN